MRLVFGLAYEGTQYAGWQYQVGVPTLQATLEKAIAQVAMQPIRVICAGRTDSGVHAVEQVIHFDTVCRRPEAIWMRAVNYYLPADIRILWVKTIPQAFHARFSAQRRVYRYLIYQGSLPWFRHYSWRVARSLDTQAMQAAAQYFIGEHDFSALRASTCQAHSPIRTLYDLHLRDHYPWVTIEVSANAFLHHMVRNLVGVLVDVGKGKCSADSIPRLLASRDRRQASITAPPQGLFLYQITYPIQFKVPILSKQGKHFHPMDELLTL